MATSEELLILQEQLMNQVVRALPNFKKTWTSKNDSSFNEATARLAQGNLSTMSTTQWQDSSPRRREGEEITRVFQGREFIACEDDYNEATDFMAEMLELHESTNRNSSSNISRLDDFIQPAMSHLPIIDLSTFDESFDKWEGFRDEFKSMIHDNPQLSDLKRFHYLCSCLKGDTNNSRYRSYRREFCFRLEPSCLPL